MRMRVSQGFAITRRILAERKPMDNSGRTEVTVPGFGLPLDAVPYNKEKPEHLNAFRTGAADYKGDRLTIREVAMLHFMDAITDKPEWFNKIENEEIVAKWRQEINATPGMKLINDAAFDWCIAELRFKADTAQRCGFVHTLVSTCSCTKTDTIITEDLRQELLDAVKALQVGAKDWHPNSNDQVLNLIHPSLYPAIYGKTRALRTGSVELKNFMDYYGKGEVLAADQVLDRPDQWRGQYYPDNDESQLWSQRFQWLPCEVKFRGESGTDVEITSYINNLHPARYENLYKIIEKFISKAIPLWNETWVNQATKQAPIRIEANGADFTLEAPYNSWELRNDVISDEVNQKIIEFLKVPDRGCSLLAAAAIDNGEEWETGNDDDGDSDWDDGDFEELCEKHEELVDDEAYSDEAVWRAKVKEVWKSVMENPETWQDHYTVDYVLDKKFKMARRVAHPEPEEFDAVDWARNSIPDIKLETDYRSKGFQVIVKMSSVELTPENPRYEGGNWHLEGMRNEHIIATAIYYYDVENLTPSKIRFRQEALLDEVNLRYEQDDHDGICCVFGTSTMRDEPAVQELGGIYTHQGRLLVFPNTLQHCVDPFELLDKSKPGHRRFLVLWLVDPDYRILSTANVPPQQADWWAEEVQSAATIVQNKVPPELADMILPDAMGWLISLDEAKELRLELMAERTTFGESVESSFAQYNLCEH